MAIDRKMDVRLQQEDAGALTGLHGLDMTIKEEYSDIASQEKTYRLTIENRGVQTVFLRSLLIRKPLSVIQQDVGDASLIELERKYRKLREEVRVLLNDDVFFFFKEVRQERMRQIEELVDYVVEKMTKNFAFLGVWVDLLLGRVWKKEMISTFLERYKAIEYDIPDAQSAQKILEKIIERNDGIDPARRDVYSQKIEQMAALERLIAPEGKQKAISAISPNSLYSTVFVFRFPRARMINQKFTLVFDAECSNTVSLGVPGQRISKSIPVSISPDPLVTTLVGVFAGLAGAIINASVSSTVSTVPDFWNLAYQTTFGANGFVAAVLAGIMVNVFQFIFSEKLEKLILDWRAAVLIGTLSGLFTDRVIAALKAFLGP